VTLPAKQVSTRHDAASHREPGGGSMPRAAAAGVARRRRFQAPSAASRHSPRHGIGTTPARAAPWCGTSSASIRSFASASCRSFSPLRKYWRVDATRRAATCRDAADDPVANHSGALPFDADVIACALHAAGQPRATRFLYDRFVENLPYVPQLYQRVGGVLASRSERRAPATERRARRSLSPKASRGSEALLRALRHAAVQQRFIRLALRHRATTCPSP